MHSPDLHFSLSDTQLPMFARLVSLAVALANGDLDTAGSGDNSSSDDVSRTPLHGTDLKKRRGWRGECVTFTTPIQIVIDLWMSEHFFFQIRP